jgi:DNA (cytosine-5)-methyltransferase 1
LIFDIAKKTQNIKIDRYYILTTFANGFVSAESEKEVTDYILELKKTQGIDIIANGIITTLKYYLRFIDNYQEFIDVYTQNLIKDAKNSTEIKSFHLEKWTEILKKYELPVE